MLQLHHLRSPPSLLSPVIPQLVCVSGLHTYQRMIGCELLEDGSPTGFIQYAYDGQDFIVFNKDTLSWVAVDNVAQITKRTWEANLHELQSKELAGKGMHCLAQEVLGVWKRYPRKDR